MARSICIAAIRPRRRLGRTGERCTIRRHGAGGAGRSDDGTRDLVAAAARPALSPGLAERADLAVHAFANTARTPWRGAAASGSLGRLGDLEVRLAHCGGGAPSVAAPRRCATASSTRRCRRSPIAHARVAARHRSLRRRLRPSARARPLGAAPPARCGSAPKSSAPTGCSARRSPSARRFLHGGRIRHRAAARAQAASALPRARPLLRAGALPQQAHGRAPLARHLGLCADARRRRDDRLREPGRHRPGPARRAALLPAPYGARAGGMAASGRTSACRGWR